MKSNIKIKGLDDLQRKLKNIKHGVYYVFFIVV